MNEHAPAGLLRRLAAAFYDALVVVALFMLTTLGVLLFRGGEPVDPGNWLYRISLIVTAALFYIGFWVKGGQTIGMRAWRIRVERRTGEPIDWKTGLYRFTAGILCMIPVGLGMLWMIVDPEKRTCYDRMTGTRVVVLPTKPKKAPLAA